MFPVRSVRALYAGGKLWLALRLANPPQPEEVQAYQLTVSWHDDGHPDLAWRFSTDGDMTMRSAAGTDWRPVGTAGQFCMRDCLEVVLPVPVDPAAVQSQALWTLRREGGPRSATCGFALPVDAGTDAAARLLKYAAANELPANASVSAEVLDAVSRFRGSLAIARQIGNVWVLRGTGLLSAPWRAGPGVLPAAVGKRAFHQEQAVRALLEAYSPFSPDPYDFVALYSADPIYQEPASPDKENVLGSSLFVGGGPNMAFPSRRVAYWGSAGRLQSVEFMASPHVCGLDLLLGMRVLAHEFGHHWLVRVRLKPGAAGGAADGEDITNPIAPGHWSWFMSTRGSLMVSELTRQSLLEPTDLGNGRYAVVPVTRPDAFSDIDLYLMGLLPAAQVQPFCLLVHPSVPFTYGPPVGEFTATRVDLTVDDLQLPRGVPPPDPAHSQKLFHTALALVTDTAPTDEDIEWINQCTREFPQYWAQVTGGLSRMDLTPEPPAERAWE
jgi:hypothetical protein